MSNGSAPFSPAAGERSSQNRRNTRQQQSRAVEDDSVARDVGRVLGAVGAVALLAYESSKSTLIYLDLVWKVRAVWHVCVQNPLGSLSKSLS